MPSTPLPHALTTLTRNFARSLGFILGGLYAVIAIRHREPRLAALVAPLCTHINRAFNRLNRLLTLFTAGRLPQPSPSRPGRSGGPRAQNLLPRGHGWVIRAFGYHAAGYRSQLAHELAKPGMEELLAAVPQASRILRPIYHMLGLSPAGAQATMPARPRPRRWFAPLPDPRNPPSPLPLPLTLPFFVLHAFQNA